MPQGRRKVAFSAKKKKNQLLQKRQLKSSQKYIRTHNEDSDGEDDETEDVTVRKLMMKPESDRHGIKRNTNRYNLCFYQEPKKELERLKLEGLKPYKQASPQQREIDQSFYDGYDFPVRPKWNYSMSKETVDLNENKYFREYVTKLQEEQKSKTKDLSLFELNLETWRQLWRVLEISDILLIIVDIRYATLMFPPALYNYIVTTIKKEAILILNKIDLVAPEVVVAWRDYFSKKYPKMPVIIFASNPMQEKKGTQQSRRLNYKRSIEGVHKIYKECEKIVQSDLDIGTWEEKILEDMSANHINTDNDYHEETIVENYTTETDDFYDDRESDGQEQQKYPKNILSLGCLGFPNVGKSSLINALKGRKVVSVSRTPGHTKHFQTIFLTHNVRLCDCPGLVFPSNTSKYLQVLLGSFPISQLQVPYRSIQLMAEHLDLPKILKLNLPEEYDEWSAIAIADAWAIKRGFFTAKTNRPDRYRAANHLLRCCVTGHCQLILQFYPPKFHEQIEQWQNHPQLDEVRKYQNKSENWTHEKEDDLLHGKDFEDSSNDDDESSNLDNSSQEDNDNLSDCDESLPSGNIFAALQDD